MSAPALAENLAVIDPMRGLTAAERTLLRKLDRHGPALMVGASGSYGWMLDGTRYTAKAMQRMIDLGLARYWREQGDVKLATNDAGQLAAYRISNSSGPVTAPEPALSDED